MSDDFAWYGENAEDVVVPEQGAIAVYLNGQGSIVIRQQQWPDDDVYIVVQPQNAAVLAHAILNAAGMEAQAPSQTLPAPRDTTAAARQRRYRERRNGDGSRDADRDVTPERDGAPLLRALIMPAAE